MILRVYRSFCVQKKFLEKGKMSGMKHNRSQNWDCYNTGEISKPPTY